MEIGDKVVCIDPSGDSRLVLLRCYEVYSGGEWSPFITLKGLEQTLQTKTHFVLLQESTGSPVLPTC